jgi:twitching motility protein PilT
MDGKGRALACEIMVVTELVKQCIREPGRTAEIKGVIEKGRTTYGLQTFDQHLIDLVNRKQITMDIARGAASSPADFERALNFE